MLLEQWILRQVGRFLILVLTLERKDRGLTLSY